MIPVIMGEDNSQFPNIVLFYNFITERDDTSAGVTNKDMTISTDFHAGSVSTYIKVGSEWCGIRTTHTPEAEIGTTHM